MTTWLYSLVSVLLVGIVSLAGILFLSINRRRLNRTILFLVSFAVGGLFGDAFIHLLPEAFEDLGLNLGTSLLVISGILAFFILEKFVRWHHCHVPIAEHRPHPVVLMNLVGDGVHNFIDGMLIAATYSVSIPLGVATTVAVLLHELPQEIGDFGILVHGGISATRALVYNFITALTAFAGAIVVLAVGPHIQGFSAVLVPITAGGFIYIAGSDLIPELHTCEPASTSLWQFCSIAAGIGIMALLVLFE